MQYSTEWRLDTFGSADALCVFAGTEDDVGERAAVGSSSLTGSYWTGAFSLIDLKQHDKKDPTTPSTPTITSMSVGCGLCALQWPKPHLLLSSGDDGNICAWNITVSE